MTAIHRVLAGLALTNVVISTSVPAQLAAPAARLSHQFSLVAGVVELPGGRVIVADSRERLLYVGDLSNDRITQLGRNGAGPREYQGVFGLVRSRGDTILGYDPGNSRLLKISPKGEITGVVGYSAKALSGGLSAPKAVDAAGHLYWDRVILSPGSNGMPIRATRYEVVRWLPGTDSPEVVATPADHAPSRHQQLFHPFAERDDWNVDGSGRVVILVASSYRARFVSPGAPPRDGPTLPSSILPVTQRERDAFRREMAAHPRGSANFRATGPSSGPSPAVLNQMKVTYPDEFFPSAKPPFGEGALRVSPGGELWVVRSGATGQNRVGVDILDANGALRTSLFLPLNARLVALAKSGIYVAREDSDGFELLERYAWPPGRR
jgi:hypothetical protein